MITSTRLLVFASGALLGGIMGCGDLPHDPVNGPDERGRPPADPVWDSFPSVPESAVAFDRVSFSTSGAPSRYVLDTVNAGFELQALWSSGIAVHTGTYTRENSVIDFDFDAWSAAGPWEATGTLENDSLHVSYNAVMILTDFESGTYVRR